MTRPVMFSVMAFGPDVDQAFESARELASNFDDERAAIATKERYTVLKPDVKVWTDNLKKQFALKALKKKDPRVARLGGPCGAIQLDPRFDTQVWLFFGWARVVPADLPETR